MPEETTQKLSELVFFLGAGASVYAGVPDTFNYVKDFKDYLGPEDRKTVDQIESTLIQWQKEQGKESKVDIELLMETLDKLANKAQEPLLEFYQNKKFVLSGYSEKSPILEKIKTYVKERSIVPEGKIKHFEHFLGFMQEYHPLDIFSVNYDICIEQFCNVYKKTFTDGFDIQWNPKIFTANNLDIRLYKLHGSITWYKTTGGSFFKSLIKSDKGQIELLTGEKAEALMLYPLRKWEYAEPLLENLLSLKNRLQSNSCKYVVVVGYSFRDNYIRDIFWDAANRNRELVVVLIDPFAYERYFEKLAFYDESKKIPSSLFERVVCLPFHFESVVHELKDLFIRNLNQGINNFNDNTTKELRGETPYWLNCLKPLANSLYVDKLEKVLTTKLYLKKGRTDDNDFRSIRNRVYRLSRRMNDSMTFTLEILFKRCLAFYVNQREKEGSEALSDFATAVYMILHEAQNVDITGGGFQLRPIAPFIKTPITMKELSELFDSFQVYQFYLEGELLNERMHKLQDFVNEISEYLMDLSNDNLAFEEYIEVRKSEFPEETEKIKKLSKEAVMNLGEPKHPSIQDLKAIVSKIERKMVKSIVGDYALVPLPRRVIIRRSKISKPNLLQ